MLSAIVLGSVLLCFVVLTIAIVADSETLRHDEAPDLSLLFILHMIIEDAFFLCNVPFNAKAQRSRKVRKELERNFIWCPLHLR